MRFGTKLENNWSTECKWATLAGRDLTPSQLIAIDHELNYRADYKDKRDAANALGVSVSFVDGFDKARNTISANPAPRGGEMLSKMKHGHMTVADYKRIANTSRQAKKMRGILAANDIPFQKETYVDFRKADSAMNYFADLADTLKELGDDVLETLEEAEFPKSYLPKRDGDGDEEEEAKRVYLVDGESQTVILGCEDVTIICIHDDAEKVAEVANLIADNVPGTDLVEDTAATYISIWKD